MRPLAEQAVTGGARGAERYGGVGSQEVIVMRFRAGWSLSSDIAYRNGGVFSSGPWLRMGWLSFSEGDCTRSGPAAIGADGS
jgi:hypothetical protein